MCGCNYDLHTSKASERRKVVQYSSTFGAEMSRRFADLFALQLGGFTQFNSRHKTITNRTIINIGRHNILFFGWKICVDPVINGATVNALFTGNRTICPALLSWVQHVPVAYIHPVTPYSPITPQFCSSASSADTHTEPENANLEPFSNAFQLVSIPSEMRDRTDTFITSLLPASGYTLYILYMHQT